MTGLIVAVDGGQSGIRVRTSASADVWEAHGASRLEGDPLVTISRLVVEAVRAHHIEDVDTLSLGLSTVPGTQKVARDFATSLGSQVHAKRVIVTDDALTHHVAQFHGAPGGSASDWHGNGLHRAGFHRTFSFSQRLWFSSR